MPRRVRNASLETRTARLRLTPRGLPYWVSLEQGLHLGYRRQKGAGTWVVRFYLGRDVRWVYRGKESSKAYEKRVIAEADDFSDANGLTVINYDQAQARARELMKRRTFAEAGVVEGPYTVARAIEDYVAYLKASGKDSRGPQVRANALIIPKLGDVEVAALTSAQLRKWLANLAEQPARRRTAKGKGQQFAQLPQGEDAVRRRKSTANRTFTILKAALNHAYDEKHVSSNDAWGRRVKPFRGVEGVRLRYLSVDEVQRLLNACQGEFRDLAQAALQTGCRFSELLRLTVSDFNKDVGTVFVARSKSSKARHVILTEEGVAFFKSLCIGRDGGERIFGTWDKTSQRRALHAAVTAGRISPSITFHGLRHTWASLGVMNGVPLQVVAANLGHADTRMVEKHYGHLAPSFIADAVRSGAPRFGMIAATNVKELKGRR